MTWPCTTTSAPRRKVASTPREIVALRLFASSGIHQHEPSTFGTPSTNGGRRRAPSPCSGSSFTTSAPRSASIRVACAAAASLPGATATLPTISRTRRPSSTWVSRLFRRAPRALSSMAEMSEIQAGEEGTGITFAKAQPVLGTKLRHRDVTWTESEVQARSADQVVGAVRALEEHPCELVRGRVLRRRPSDFLPLHEHELIAEVARHPPSVGSPLRRHFS